MKSIIVGLFLAKKAIKRTGLLSKTFIIVMMALTFLNLLVVRGVLVGIPDSSLLNIRTDEIGDILISRLEGENEIEQTYAITQYLDKHPDVFGYSVRYRSSAGVESDYGRSKKDGANASKRSTVVFGIDPGDEERVTAFSRFIIDGRFLEVGDTNSIVLGKGMLATYSTPSENFTDEQLLQNVYVDSKVLVTIGNDTREYRVVGITSNKGQADNRAYITDTQMRLLLGSNNPNASEIAIRLADPALDGLVTKELRGQFGAVSKPETSLEASGEFLTDIKTIFDFLSAFVGLIGIVISGITIFIVIFINAMSRRKEIGVMRAIGVPKRYITISYLFQSMFYAGSGIVLALGLFFGLIEPYFRQNPIDFPFTDVYLAVSFPVILIQVAILLFAAFLAGYIPSRIVIKRKILALLLGR